LQAEHDIDDDVESIYEIKGKPLDLAQKIMQSDGNQTFFESDIAILNFNYVSVTESIANAIIFDDDDIERNTGLIDGDIIEIDTYGQFTVDSFGQLDTGSSYIVVKEQLPTVVDVTEAWRFRSQYNVLNFGLGMQPFEVDNQEFESIKSIFSPNFVDMTFYIEEGIENARDFINDQLYFVSGCYGVPRNARASVRFLSPPLTSQALPTLNASNVNNLISLKPIRTVNNFYYNDILFAFDKSIRDGKFKSYTQFIDDDSKDRFNVGLKQLFVSSDGLRRDGQTALVIDRLAGRFLDRYKGAAISIRGVELSMKTGFNLNIGDVVLFGGESTKLVDYETGLRNLPIAKYEIINQTIDLRGVVKVDLLSTGFSVTGTYATISPSSRVLAGSTVSELILGPINNLDEFDVERNKYSELIDQKIRVRSDDYTYDYTTTITDFSTQNNSAIIIDALPVAPPENAIIELASYPDQPIYGTDDDSDALKLRYSFTMNQDAITVSIDNTSFEVANPGEFFEGQEIGIHSDDFTRDVFSTTIETIVGSVITVSDTLDFTPQVDDKVESRENADLDGYLIL
jgi:hypothetical protein